MAACFGSDTDPPSPHPVEYPAYVRVDVQCMQCKHKLVARRDRGRKNQTKGHKWPRGPHLAMADVSQPSLRADCLAAVFRRLLTSHIRAHAYVCAWARRSTRTRVRTCVSSFRAHIENCVDYNVARSWKIASRTRRTTELAM